MAGTKVVECCYEGIATGAEASNANVSAPDASIPDNREAAILGSDLDLVSSHSPSYYISLEKVYA